jgi:hypothetical protein
MTLCVIYDFETLGQNVLTCPALSFAVLKFNEDRFLSDSPYTYKELIDSCDYIKLDVMEQVRNYGRKPESEAIDWWKQQNEEAQRVLKPEETDASIEQLYDVVYGLVRYESRPIEKTYARGPGFDSILLQSLLAHISKTDPFPWRSIRDTRSMIDGMLIGSNMSNKFVPEELKMLFVEHDPRHDISMDVMRMQTLQRSILLDG